jgi:GNAT superfamily N-acetyltransferase
MIRVQVLTADDWPAWRGIRLRALQDSPEAFGSTYEREVGFTETEWRERTGAPDSVSVLAHDGERPVGMGGGFSDLPGWLHVVAMWVEPAARGRGVGRAVLRALETWADEHRLRLHLDVSIANDAARAVYTRYGFRGSGESRPLREGSALLVERMVLPRRPAVDASRVVDGRDGRDIR